jgi:hypothetical protein
VISDLNDFQGPLQDVDKPKGNARVQVRHDLSSGLQIDLESSTAVQVVGPPSCQPTWRQSGETKSMESAIQDSLGRVALPIEGPEIINGSEAFKECDTSIGLLVAPSQLLQTSKNPPSTGKSNIWNMLSDIDTTGQQVRSALIAFWAEVFIHQICLTPRIPKGLATSMYLVSNYLVLSIN